MLVEAVFPLQSIKHIKCPIKNMNVFDILHWEGKWWTDYCTLVQVQFLIVSTTQSEKMLEEASSLQGVEHRLIPLPGPTSTQKTMHTQWMCQPPQSQPPPPPPLWQILHRPGGYHSTPAHLWSESSFAFILNPGPPPTQTHHHEVPQLSWENIYSANHDAQNLSLSFGLAWL